MIIILIYESYKFEVFPSTIIFFKLRNNIQTSITIFFWKVPLFENIFLKLNCFIFKNYADNLIGTFLYSSRIKEKTFFTSLTPVSISALTGEID